jgi:hypothetical protein
MILGHKRTDGHDTHVHYFSASRKERLNFVKQDW